MLKKSIKRIFKNKTVLEEGFERMNWIFDEFENVVVGFSGGKDSTVVLNMALKIAEERNRLPLKVIFIDQEAEWQGTIDYVKEVMYDSRVEPMWFQMPMVITNNASSFKRYNYCWEEGEEENWIHERDPISIKENVYGTDRFHELFGAIIRHHFPNEKACYVAGVRCEESPKRLMSLTYARCYKDVTWGTSLRKKKSDPDYITFYPLYDWSYSDIWKYIHDNNLPYCNIYNELYRQGKKVRDMRISNLHHETAVQDLLWVQEIEPKTWEKLSHRIDGADAIKHLEAKAFSCPAKLPYMFKDWKEYSDYLAENIIQEQQYRDLYYKEIGKYDKYLINDLVRSDFYRHCVGTILASDWDFTKLHNFTTGYEFYTLKRYVDKKITLDELDADRKFAKYVEGLI